MATVEKLSITLSRDMAQMVRDKVGSGAYASNSEVIRDALRLLQEQDQLKSQRLNALRDKISRSIDDPRPSLDAEEVFARLDTRRNQTDAE